MGIVSVVVLAVIVVAIGYLIMLYNSMVQVKHNVSKAWANIDVLLKQRHDELPKLVETCKQHMKFEQQTLQKVMEARSQVSSARKSQNIQALGPAYADAALPQQSVRHDAHRAALADDADRAVSRLDFDEHRGETRDGASTEVRPPLRVRADDAHAVCVRRVISRSFSLR